MKHTLTWIFAIIVAFIGIVNIAYEHILPGIIYLLLSIVFLPSTQLLLKERLGFNFPFWLKIILFLLLAIFTFGLNELLTLI